MCASATDTLNNLLAVKDTDLVQTQTWSLLVAPLHGTAYVTDAESSGRDTVMPHGLYYTAAPSYTGADSFTVIVTDGIAYDTTVIHVGHVASPSYIAGAMQVCAGAATTLSDTVSGGVWASGNTSIATIGSAAGVMAGIAGGIDTIYYTLSSTGCTITKIVTVNRIPAVISGLGGVCTGNTINLSDSIAGGTWATGSTLLTVGSSTGAVTGVSAGTATITYTSAAGCSITGVVTVNQLPTVITGAGAVCSGSTLTLSDATTGGAWSTIASAGSVGSGSGVVTGISAGTATITYTISSGCYRTATVTVNPLPAAIGGIVSTGICPEQTETLTESGSGVWMSGSVGIATIGSSSGMVTGVSGGAATITFTLPTGCSTTTTVGVNSAPGPITGITSTCTYSTSTLADTTHGGVWLSSDYSIADVDTGGVVTGYDIGSTTVRYMATDGCVSITTFTTNPAPGAITGIFSLCTGGTVTLSNSVSGGTWSSSDTTKAKITATTGIVTGIAPGTVTMTYSMGAGCSVGQTINVLSPPTGIIGAGAVCRGNSLSLTETGSGGVECGGQRGDT